MSAHSAHKAQNSGLTAPPGWWWVRSSCDHSPAAAAVQELRQEGGDGDSYVPGKVSFPAGAGRVVQVSAGASNPLHV